MIVQKLVYQLEPYYQVEIGEATVHFYSYYDKQKVREMSVSCNGTTTRYPQVQIIWKGIRRAWQAHQIVAELVYGPKPSGMQINHIDGNKNNYHPSNLEYVTPKENNAHARRMGLIVPQSGEEHGQYTHGLRVKNATAEQRSLINKIYNSRRDKEKTNRMQREYRRKRKESNH